MAAGNDALSLFLAGDVMTGRGVDQILAHPGDPALREDSIHDARAYVRLAERASGPVPRPVAPEYLWGELLGELERASPSARIINLETSITANGGFAPEKGIHYRMHPQNLRCLTCARLDVCVLSNNHVLDFGREGLRDTLDQLHAAGLQSCGAGRDRDEAEAPARLDGLCVFGLCAESSGVPPGWAAASDRPGVALIEPSPRSADALLRRIDRLRGTERVVVSIHWGGNWGDAIPEAHVAFARRLVDGGVDLVHGHSSHHPRAIEVYRGKLILYGCGDLIDDYEGIGGYEAYGPDPRLAYFAQLDEGRLRIVPYASRRMRLEAASAEDAAALARSLTALSARFGSRFVAEDRALRLIR